MAYKSPGGNSGPFFVRYGVLFATVPRGDETSASIRYLGANAGSSRLPKRSATSSPQKRETTSQDISFPEFHAASNLLSLNGQFDGDLTDTMVTIGGRVATILVETKSAALVKINGATP